MATLSTNLKFNNATTQFTNFRFNSMCNFNGVQLGAGDNGLCRLGGNDDAGAEISAFFEPIQSDWGVSNPKRIRFMYFGYECDGALSVSVTGGDNASYTGSLPCRLSGAQQQCRVTISRLVRSRYMKFRISNTNGCDFSIDAIDCLFIVRSNGFS